MNPEEIKKAEKRKVRKNSILIILLLSAVLLLSFVAFCLYRIYAPNTLVNGREYFLLIPTKADFRDVTDSLNQNGILKSTRSFEWVAGMKKYPDKIRSGRYRITSGMSNNDLIDLLRSGKQSPVKLTFNNIRTKKQLAGRLSRQLETDSIRLLEMLQDSRLADSLGFTTENILCLFIPNTYEIYWNTPADKLIRRMVSEYHAFWNQDRLKKASGIGLKPDEVSILASIVEMETTKNDEKPTIAGVYLNRLSKDIPLEADPTLVYALGDYSIQRLLKKDMLLESPYNTYKNKGLPPGPITMPSIASIMAVLEPVRHDKMFFCAKPDFSGYHHFSRTYSQHLRYAREYQAALDRANIKR